MYQGAMEIPLHPNYSTTGIWTEFGYTSMAVTNFQLSLVACVFVKAISCWIVKQKYTLTYLLLRSYVTPCAS